jgi:hypothetical protein
MAAESSGSNYQIESAAFNPIDHACDDLRDTGRHRADSP